MAHIVVTARFPAASDEKDAPFQSRTAHLFHERSRISTDPYEFQARIAGACQPRDLKKQIRPFPPVRRPASEDHNVPDSDTQFLAHCGFRRGIRLLLLPPRLDEAMHDTQAVLRHAMGGREILRYLGAAAEEEVAVLQRRSHDFSRRPSFDGFLEFVRMGHDLCPEGTQFRKQRPIYYGARIDHPR